MQNDAYGVKELATPPVLQWKENPAPLLGGHWVIRVIDGEMVYEAPVGEWFARQVIEKMVLPFVPK